MRLTTTWRGSKRRPHRGFWRLQFAVLMLAAFAVDASAEPLELKGFRLGAPLASCPAGEQTGIPLSVGVRAGVETCNLGPTTFAGKPASTLYVYLFEGRLIGVSIQLKEKGRYSNGSAKEALLAKYGHPSRESKTHLNQWRWDQDGNTLSLDAWDGWIWLRDNSAWLRSSAQEGAKNKSDT